MSPSRLVSWFLPALLAALVVGVLGEPERMPWGDGPFLQAVAWRLSATLRAGNVPEFLGGLWSQATPHPPLGYLPVILGDLLAQSPTWGGRLGAGLGLWLLLHGTTRLIRARYPDVDAVGVALPLLALASSPLVWLSVDQVGWDLFTAAAVAHALAALVESQGLTQRGAAARFGAWMAVGFLTKFSFPLFLWLPCLLTGLGLVLADPERVRRRGLAVAVVVFSLLAGPWYLVHFGTIQGYIGTSVDAPETISASARSGGSLLTWSALSYYPLALKDAWGWPGLLVLLVATARAGRGRTPVVPTLAAVGGVIALSLLSQALDRYALPALACLVVPLATVRAEIDRWGTAACFGLLLLGSVLGFRPGAPATSAPSYVHAATELGWPKSRTYVPSDIDVDAWQVDAALDAAAALGPGDTVGLLLPFDFHLPDVGVFLLREAEHGSRFDLFPVRPPAFSPLPESMTLPDAVRVLYAVDEQAVPEPSRASWLQRLGFIPVQRFELPGGRTGELYQRPAA